MLEGTVVSAKMQKTAVVEIASLKLKGKYKKFVKSKQRFKAHNENDLYQAGDRVVIQEIRPMSKEKHWLIVKKITVK